MNDKPIRPTSRRIEPKHQRLAARSSQHVLAQVAVDQDFARETSHRVGQSLQLGPRWIGRSRAANPSVQALAQRRQHQLIDPQRIGVEVSQTRR
ncbi:hypothetical protein SM19410_00840 [Xanthomonas hortorum pv. gardneri]|uniref:Uncharacterized protein n=1 Tax=Xanthomonas vesicatoria TaxID=56460 RepID=A0AAJ0IWB9_9XANT|nr:hypothetical protein BJD13_00600 [Xanthomonas perforans]KHM92611.1 hypothetical protein OR61_16245 [Xanthomonas vesicatoria]KLB02544.1 hypothetical protein SM19410_00840 [Xanthomonas hortorum pv. gardneri]KLB24872.1 hypothetical protein SM41311_06010 [Xanthomonas hortorum pv. gardneri]KLB26196.1 hypothetical protein SM40611_03970 [Xanthomonas hortorum pv. gardneri]